MAVVTFVGDPQHPGSDPAVLHWHGISFPLDKPVEVDDQEHSELLFILRRHSHFHVSNLGLADVLRWLDRPSLSQPTRS